MNNPRSMSDLSRTGLSRNDLNGNDLSGNDLSGYDLGGTRHRRPLSPRAARGGRARSASRAASVYVMAAAILTTVFIVGCAPATQPATPVAGTSGPTSGAADATVDTPTSEVPDGTKTADTTASPGAEETVTAAAIDSFESCVAAGRPVMESYPRQCRGPDGELYVEDIGNEVEMLDTIRVDTPRPGASVTSPVTVAGEARGTWYFEASFPVRLVSRDGETLAVVPATAQGEWMTEEFVPFEAALDLDPEFAGYTGPARLILEKANPSGLEEHAASLNFPVEIIP